jgi:mRNA-degrading endonuclease toxin of MazEF toxin-antitoxin module
MYRFTYPTGYHELGSTRVVVGMHTTRTRRIAIAIAARAKTRRTRRLSSVMCTAISRYHMATNGVEVSNPGLGRS